MDVLLLARPTVSLVVCCLVCQFFFEDVKTFRLSPKSVRLFYLSGESVRTVELSNLSDSSDSFVRRFCGCSVILLTSKPFDG